MMFPETIGYLIQSVVSMTRIRKFLLKDEIDETQITHLDTGNKWKNPKNLDILINILKFQKGKNVIQIDKADLSWNEIDSDLTLKK